MSRHNFDQKTMLQNIEQGQPVELIFPVINQSIQSVIHTVIDALLEKYNKAELTDAFYSSIKEMIINGIKANVKHYYFLKNNIQADSEEDLKKGFEQIRYLMDEKGLEEFESIARKHNLHINVSILHNEERIMVIVENSSPLSEYEDLRIRDKFNKALRYDSIVDYYMENADDTEGSGLGITMIVLMLKGYGIDPHAFTVDSKNRKSTIAKIEFPISEPNILRNQNS